jgi:signal transduction histidine kinase
MIVDASSPNCPQCGSPVAPQDAICQVCGADIALVTLMAERALVGRATHPEALRPVSVEQLVPRLGDHLLRKGHVSKQQLDAALARQAAAAADGKPPRRVGETLVDMGVITRETLDQAIAEQILDLQTALIEANRSLEKRVAERTAELEAALLKLTEFNQLKANFVSNISHELRTPLTQIRGYNALLVDTQLGPLTPEQKEALTTTHRAIERLERLITDLISYAAAAKGELTLNLRPLSLPMLLARVVEKSAPKAQKQNTALITSCPPDIPPVTGDEEKLHWVILQLVDNAIKFTPGGGQVTVSAALDNRRVRLAVRDTGIGIAPQRLDDIFEPFQQLDGSSTRRYGGTGLGLALVKRIVEAHGAQVVVESQEGRGTTVSFTLPQATNA